MPVQAADVREPSAAGRNCPLSYRYRPEDFTEPPVFETDILYVVGGLYGNLEALYIILEMAERERRTNQSVRIVFNGDFNWFNIDGADFEFINRTVFAHAACLGNVEFEIATPSLGAGCGCAYPAYVSEIMVQRSNAIMQRLQQTASAYPALRRALTALPLHLTVSVASERIAILHGDPESLAGWAFSVEHMPPADTALRERMQCGDSPAMPVEQITDYFQRANVRVFACSHTCLPFAQVVEWVQGPGLVINNGTAGMPNFQGTHFGVMTRIASDTRIPVRSLYGLQLGRLRCDAIAVEYDQRSWLRRFRKSWSLDSPAYQNYFRRITYGPDYAMTAAVRTGVTKTIA